MILFSFPQDIGNPRKPRLFSKTSGFPFPTMRTALVRSIIIPSDAVFCNRFCRTHRKTVCRFPMPDAPSYFCSSFFSESSSRYSSQRYSLIDGMDIVVKEQNQSGTYSIIIVRKVISRKLPFLYQPPRDGMIAEIPHIMPFGLCRCPFGTVRQANSRRYRSVNRGRDSPSFSRPDSTQAHSRDAGI